MSMIVILSLFSQRAQAVYDENWARGISHAPYLKDSPAAPFLKRYRNKFARQCVMIVSCCDTHSARNEHVKNVRLV